MNRAYLYGAAGIALAVVLSAAVLPTLGNFIKIGASGTPVERTWESTASSNQLTLALRLDANKYKVGDRMNVTLRLTNGANSRVTLVFSSSQKFDFEVVDESGKEVQKWSSGRFFLQVITEIALEPGETLEQTLPLVTDLPTGSYVIKGMTARFTIDEGSAVTLKTRGIGIQVTT